MNNRKHALRNLALKLNVSGTAEVLDATKLYQGSYGFIKLQVYAPKTQNTEAPMCTVYCTTTDRFGKEKISSKNYPLLYAGEFVFDGASYLLFEQYLPKEFTETATSPNGLKLTVNYYDTAVTKVNGEIAYDANGVPKRHATDLLVSSRYMTTVYEGGWNNDDVELKINAAEAAQIAENMRHIAELQTDMERAQAIAESKMDKLPAATVGHFVAIGESGNATDSGYDFTDIEQAQEDVHAVQGAVKQTLNEFQSLAADTLSAAQDEVSRAKEEVLNAQAEVENAQAEVLNARQEADRAALIAEEARTAEKEARGWAEMAKEFASFGLKVKVVSSLPETGNAQYIYLVKASVNTGNNDYDEYMWVEDEENGIEKYEKIGTMDIDLTNYITKESAAETYVNKSGDEMTGALKAVGVYDTGHRVYSSDNKPTPAEIGALPLTGGTLTGNLGITGSNYPSLTLTAPNDERLYLELNPSGSPYFVARKGGDSTGNHYVLTFPSGITGSKTFATKEDSVQKSGDTMTDILKISKSGGDAYFVAESTSTKNRIDFGIGGSGVNRGIWDETLGKWIFHTDGTKVYVNGVEPYSSANPPPASATPLYQHVIHIADKSGTRYPYAEASPIKIDIYATILAPFKTKFANVLEVAQYLADVEAMSPSGTGGFRLQWGGSITPVGTYSFYMHPLYFTCYGATGLRFYWQGNIDEDGIESVVINSVGGNITFEDCVLETTVTL